MPRWFRITKTYCIGLFAVGLLLFFLQQLPYLVMPAIPMAANPLVEMVDKIAVLNLAEKVLGVSCVLLMLFLLRDDTTWFSLKMPREKLWFAAAVAALVVYYAGWVLYFTGTQTLPVLLGILVAMPPIYYSAIGLWRRNVPLAILGVVFLCVHMANVSVNLLGV
ncbi:MAG: hypothetical protein LBS17_02045 [Actinomycetes bacterium]|jgi:hypothetical protein|nr:hypothetical protein [Actinomycetes bacterium]